MGMDLHVKESFLSAFTAEELHLPGGLKFRGSVLDTPRLNDSGEGLLSGRGDLRPIWELSYGLSRLDEEWKAVSRGGWSKAVGLGEGLLSM